MDTLHICEPASDICLREKIQLAVRKIVSRDVGLAGILFWVPYRITGHTGVEWIAWTDGSAIYFGHDFFGFSESEQLGIIVHETLHVAFRHRQRGDRLRQREGDGYNHFLWVFSCDCIINHGIRQLSWLSLPAGAANIADVIRKEDLEQKPAALWTAEEIYRYVLQYAIEVRIAAAGFGCVPDLQVVPDLQADAKAPIPHINQRSIEDVAEDRVWGERIRRAQAGSQPGSVLRKISADIPKPEVAWEAVLREFVVARVMPRTKASWNRPSRRTLALDMDVVEPGIERARGIRRIGIVMDTSGSIEEGLLAKFVAEIEGIVARTGCEVMLVVSDAAVHSVDCIRGKLPAGYRFKGGGGTDFRPGIEKLNKYAIACAVYLTDLCGTFPEKNPSFPLLWATTQDLDVPFGRKVLLKSR